MTLEQLEHYALELGFPTATIQRILDGHKKVAALLGTVPEGAFISEYRDANQQRVAQSVAFFSDSLWAEVDDLESTPALYLVPITDGIRLLKLTPTDYDLVKATAGSRLVLEYKTSDNFEGDWHLQASGDNCDKLTHLAKSALLPNLMS